MAETTHTLAQIRQDICQKLNMPFFKRFPSGGTLTGTPTTTKLYDSSLTQEQDFWKGYWAYIPDAQETRFVTYFKADNEEIGLEFALSTAPSADDSYELLSIWNASEIHKAINEAIEEAFPAFFDTVIDETIVIEEDKLDYTISDLSSKVYRMLNVWFETVSTSLSGTADSGGAATLTDANLVGQLSDVDTDWKISVYSGTGHGQLRSVSSVDNATGEVTVTSNWTTQPSDDSKYLLWDPTDQETPWDRLYSAQFDNSDQPSIMYLLALPTQYYGARMRLQYISEPVSLSAESDTTVIPLDYLRKQVLHILYDGITADSRFDRSSYAQMAEYQRQKAEQKKQEAWDMPSGTLWQYEATPSSPSDDPMGWTSIAREM